MTDCNHRCYRQSTNAQLGPHLFTFCSAQKSGSIDVRRHGLQNSRDQARAYFSFCPLTMQSLVIKSYRKTLFNGSEEFMQQQQTELLSERRGHLSILIIFIDILQNWNCSTCNDGKVCTAVAVVGSRVRLPRKAESLITHGGHLQACPGNAPGVGKTVKGFMDLAVNGTFDDRILRRSAVK